MVKKNNGSLFSLIFSCLQSPKAASCLKVTTPLKAGCCGLSFFFPLHAQAGLETGYPKSLPYPSWFKTRTYNFVINLSTYKSSSNDANLNVPSFPTENLTHTFTFKEFNQDGESESTIEWKVAVYIEYCLLEIYGHLREAYPSTYFINKENDFKTSFWLEHIQIKPTIIWLYSKAFR